VSATRAEVAAALILAHTPISVTCRNLRGVTQLLRRRGYRTVDSVGRGSHTWLCAPRKDARTYTAVGRWEGGTLRIWGPVPVLLGVRLAAEDVGALDSIRLPRGVLEWAASELERAHPDPTPGPRKLSPARRIRLAYVRASDQSE